ncbi:17522_t:CDS:1 [Funneliformis caledonium]|uniref:17522_t:CDS:1 n=1 Tax=Funneliformis caledonium TaxID=1117310 RepID=A0A9N9CWP2_9GLOM|nr:17522_t:CDS:1 [Funneliformis caledonium]
MNISNNFRRLPRNNNQVRVVQRRRERFINNLQGSRFITLARHPRIINQGQNQRARFPRIIRRKYQRATYQRRRRVRLNADTLNRIVNLPTQMTNDINNLSNIDHMLVEEFFNGASFVQTLT